MARIPGQGVAASSAGSTTAEASTMEVQELGVTSPPPGLTPLDFANWSLPLPGAPQTGDYPYPLVVFLELVDKLQAHRPQAHGSQHH